MIIPVVFATHLARAVDLFRDPAKKDEQKREFRILVGMLKGGDVSIRILDDVLVVNDQRVIAPEFRPLVQSMVAHAVTEMVIPSDAPVSNLFELLRALADHPTGPADIAARLRSTGANRVSVVLSALDEPEEGGTPAAAGGAGTRDLGTRGVLRGEPVKDLKSAPVAGADGVESVEQNLAQPSEALPVPEAATPSQAIIPRQSAETPSPGLPATPLESVAPAPGTLPPPPPPPPPPPKRAVDSAAPTFTPATPAPPAPHAPPPPPPPPPPAAPPTPRVHLHSGSVAPPQFADAPQEDAAEPPAPAAPEIAREAASPLFALREALSKDTADMLSTLEANPATPHVGEMLTVLNRQVETVMRQGKIEQAMQIVYNVVRAEQRVEDPAVRRQYGIALRRMITKQMLDGLSKLVQVPHLEDAAGAVLQRAGPDGMEVLLDLLTTSNTVTERRGVFNALIQMKEGQDQLVHMLGHPQWFVVRNVADLVGELGLEAAVPALTKQLDHDDERVRRQVALALAKIGTRSAAEPLRRALRDSSADVRRQAALGVGGRKASALAMPLVVALEEEKDPEVVRELIFALGRIGSPDAVQALIKLAQPSGKLFNRKPSALRVTAVEALRVAGTPAAIGTLQGFAADSDKQVRAAVQQALTELNAKQRS
jgi:HEAT repeat protein